jgi:hypothetical protein
MPLTNAERKRRWREKQMLKAVHGVASSPNVEYGVQLGVNAVVHVNSVGQLSTAASDDTSIVEAPSVESIYASIPFVKEVEWTTKLFKWYSGECERTHRYAAYVFGAGGEGKTRVVRALVAGKNVYECRLTERFAFEGFNPSVDILLIDEVNWICFEPALRSTLLNIMARQPSVIQRKYKPQITVENNKVLTIFTSNYKLPSELAYRRRCYNVWAKQKACIDATVNGEDDPGDDDSTYVNPKAVGICQYGAAMQNSWKSAARSNRKALDDSLNDW